MPTRKRHSLRRRAVVAADRIDALEAFFLESGDDGRAEDVALRLGAESLEDFARHWWPVLGAEVKRRYGPPGNVWWIDLYIAAGYQEPDEWSRPPAPPAPVQRGPCRLVRGTEAP
jgi:hypothetical protein